MKIYFVRDHQLGRIIGNFHLSSTTAKKEIPSWAQRYPQLEYYAAYKDTLPTGVIGLWGTDGILYELVEASVES